MHTSRLTVSDGERGSTDSHSSFRTAFSQARRESRSVGVERIGERATYEVRIEKRSGKRSEDVARWNNLGQDGWKLISVVGKQAFFRRDYSSA